MATIDKLVIALGFDLDAKGMKTVREFDKSIGDVANTVKQLSRVVVGATAALTGFVAASTAITDEQGKMAKEIGMSVGQLDALQTAGQLAGDSAQGISSALQQLSIRASESSRGIGAGVEAFGLLGVSAVGANGSIKNTSQLMVEISGAMSRLGRAQQIELADKLGLRSAIRLLQTGPGAIQAQMKALGALGTTTAEDAHLAAEFQDNLTLTTKALRNMGRQLVNVAAPGLIKLSKAFRSWYIENKKIIGQRLNKLFEALTKNFKLLTVAAGAFLGIQLVGALASIVKVVNTLTISVFRLPILLGLLGAALLLAAEDAYVFFNGGESLMGDYLKKFPEMREAILALGPAFATIWDLVLSSKKGWEEFFKVATTAKSGDVASFFKDLPKVLGTIFGNAQEEIRIFLQHAASSVPFLSRIIKSMFDHLRFAQNWAKGIGKVVLGLFSSLGLALKDQSLQPIKFWYGETRKIFEDLFREFKGLAFGAVDVFLKNFPKLQNFFKKVVNFIVNIFQGVFLGVYDFIGFIAEKFVDVVKSMSGVSLEGVVDGFRLLPKTLGLIFEDVLKKFDSMIMLMLKDFPLLSKTYANIKLGFKATTNFIEGLFSGLGVSFGDVVALINDPSLGNFEAVFKRVIGSVSGELETAGNKIVDHFINKIKAGLQKLVSRFSDLLRPIIEIKTNIKALANPIEFVESAWAGFKKSFPGLSKTLLKIKTNIKALANPIEFIKSAWRGFKKWFSGLDLFEDSDLFGRLVKSAQEKIEEIKTLFSTIFDTALEKLKTRMGKTFGGLSNKFKSFFGVETAEEKTVTKTETTFSEVVQKVSTPVVQKTKEVLGLAPKDDTKSTARGAATLFGPAVQKTQRQETPRAEMQAPQVTVEGTEVQTPQVTVEGTEVQTPQVIINDNQEAGALFEIAKILQRVLSKLPPEYIQGLKEQKGMGMIGQPVSPVLTPQNFHNFQQRKTVVNNFNSTPTSGGKVQKMVDQTNNITVTVQGSSLTPADVADAISKKLEEQYTQTARELDIGLRQ